MFINVLFIITFWSGNPVSTKPTDHFPSPRKELNLLSFSLVAVRNFAAYSWLMLSLGHSWLIWKFSLFTLVPFGRNLSAWRNLDQLPHFRVCGSLYACVEHTFLRVCCAHARFLSFYWHEKALKWHMFDKNLIIYDKILALTQIQKTESLLILKSDF